LISHAYEPAWQALGDEGDHFGATHREFAASVLAPLVK